MFCMYVSMLQLYGVSKCVAVLDGSMDYKYVGGSCVSGLDDIVVAACGAQLLIRRYLSMLTNAYLARRQLGTQ